MKKACPNAIVFVFALVALFFFLTAVRAETSGALAPAGDGGNDSADWKNHSGAACAGADCSSAVNESACDNDSSYIKSDLDGANQTFALDESGIENGSTITQIDITVCAARGQGGAKIETRYCHNGSCLNSGDQINLNNSYAQTTQSFAGLTIVKDAATDLEIGVANAKNKTAKVSWISAVITYSPPANDSAAAQAAPEGGGRGYTGVILSGQAYPGSTVEVLKKNLNEHFFTSTDSGNPTVAEDGKFRVFFPDVQRDLWIFGLRFTDREGRQTAVLPFNFNLLTGIGQIVEDILAPPTVGFEPVVRRGSELSIAGAAAPRSAVEFFLDDLMLGQARADEAGQYRFSTTTAAIGLGNHQLKAWQIDGSGRVSLFSSARILRISSLTITTADFNRDDKINLTDWSIFLFRWGAGDRAVRQQADVDGNGQVDLTDFSIFLRAIKI